MKLRFIVSLLALVTFFGLTASAQELPKIDASVNYSYLRANPGTSGFNGFNLNGGSASAAYNFKDWVSGVADFGGYHALVQACSLHPIPTRHSPRRSAPASTGMCGTVSRSALCNSTTC